MDRHRKWCHHLYPPDRKWVFKYVAVRVLIEWCCKKKNTKNNQILYIQQRLIFHMRRYVLKCSCSSSMFVLCQLPTRQTNQVIHQEVSSVSMAMRVVAKWQLGPLCHTARWLTLSSLSTVTETLSSSSQLFQVNRPDHIILPLIFNRSLLYPFSRLRKPAPGIFVWEIVFNITCMDFKNCEVVRGDGVKDKWMKHFSHT